MSSVPTVEQIAKDTLTQISLRYWYHQDDDTTPLEAFDPQLIEDIYINELLKSR